jgi:fructokinase
LIGKPLKHDLEAALQREVRIANDANCFALSEAVDGAGAGARVVFGVILGTGVGGGIVIDGKLLTGANAIAGEWGHNPLAGEHHRETCYCGRRGCIELYLSGPGLARDHRRVAGADYSALEIAQQAATGDAAADATLQRYEARLARALAQVINILDPNVIVLGGGLSNVDRLCATVPRLWGEHVFSDQVTTKLLKHKHGDSSGVRGAAWLWN